MKKELGATWAVQRLVFFRSLPGANLFLPHVQARPPPASQFQTKSYQAPSCSSHLPRSVWNKQKVLLQNATGVKRSRACTLSASFLVSRTWMFTNGNKHHQRYSSWASKIPHIRWGGRTRGQSRQEGNASNGLGRVSGEGTGPGND